VKILVTGGVGYIGSHTCVELLNAGYEVVVVDNLSNSNEKALERVKQITNKNIKFYQEDLLNYPELKSIFLEEIPDAVIHFAGLKAVGESVEKPLWYYENNIVGTINLIKVMKETNVKNLVFSSSATVYGMAKTVPIKEDFPLSSTNPYGATKLMIEQILMDVVNADNSWKIISLRYFNPVGAHKSGLIGEDPNGIPNNLLPFISQVAVGKRNLLSVFGNDYNTIDGTGVRDYIHVVDLALGHIKALDKISDINGYRAYNLGTGRGISVLQMINAFEKASGIKINYKIVERRNGDVAKSYADPSLANSELNWEAKLTIEDICKDAWNWQKNNPEGYK
jgi:UDP-glucose 4-epimerase